MAANDAQRSRGWEEENGRNRHLFEELRRIIRSHQLLCYPLPFRESAGTLQDVAGNEKHLGATLGFLGVLHTWTRQLEYHPKVWPLAVARLCKRSSP